MGDSPNLAAVYRLLKWLLEQLARIWKRGPRSRLPLLLAALLFSSAAVISTTLPALDLPGAVWAVPVVMFLAAFCFLAFAFHRVLHEQGPLGDWPKDSLPYAQEDHELFLKLERAQEINQLEDLVLSHSARLIAVSSPDGGGKTSLLVAGLVPRLKSVGCFYWRAEPDASSDDLFRSILKQWDQVAPREPWPTSLPDFLNWAGAPKALIVDDFHLLKPHQQEEFLLLFSAALVAPAPVSLTWIVAFSSTYLAEWNRLRGRLPQPSQDKIEPFPIAQFTAFRARRVLEELCEHYPLPIERDVIARLSHDLSLGGQPGEVLPLALSVAAGVITKRIRYNGRSPYTIASYLQDGALAGLLGDFLDSLQSSASPQLGACSRILLPYLSEEVKQSVAKTRRRLHSQRIVRYVAAILFSLAAIGLPLWLLMRDSGERFTAWSLPTNIERCQGTLQRLELVGVNDLDWLSADLQHLSLLSVTLENLDDLPGSLSSLRLIDSTVHGDFDLPDSVSRLDLRGTTLQGKVRWPAHLKELHLANAMQLNSFAEYGSLLDLRTLDVDDCSARDLQGLPKNLEHLSVGCSTLEGLTGTPSSTLSLKVVDTSTATVQLPPHLNELELEGTKLLHVASLPESLRRLRVRRNSYGQRATIEVPKLPALVELEMDFDAIKRFLPLPSSLRKVVIEGFDGDNLDFLPPSVSCLTFINGRVDQVPSEKWPNLESLELRGNIGVDLSRLPRRLGALRLSGDVSSLEGLPTNLRWLDLTGTRVVDISNLPDSIETLIFRSNSIRRIDNLPDSLRHLDLYQGLTEELSDLRPGLLTLRLGYTNIGPEIRIPNSVQALDLRNTRIHSLDPLPSKLRKLALSPGQVELLPRLPDELSELWISEMGEEEDNWLPSLCPEGR